MIFYVFFAYVFSLFLIFFYLDKISLPATIKQKKYGLEWIFFILVTPALVFFSAFRFESGIDYFPYRELYYLGGLQTTEILFWIVSDLHRYIFYSYPGFIFVVTTFIVFGKVFFIKKNCGFFYFSLYIYVCISYIYIDMGLVRNSIALLFFLFSLKNINENKYISIFWFVVAFLFHHAVAMLVYMFFIREFSRNKLLILLISSVALAMIEIVPNLLTSVLAVAPIPDYVSWKINYYLSNEEYLNRNINIYNIRYLCVSIFMLINLNAISCGYFRRLVSIYLLGTCLIILFGFNVQIYTRMGTFVSFIEVITVPYLISINISHFNRRIYSLLFCIMYIVLFVRSSYVMEIFNVRFL